jgi:hypothetical protein
VLRRGARVRACGADVARLLLPRSGLHSSSASACAPLATGPSATGASCRRATPRVHAVPAACATRSVALMQSHPSPPLSLRSLLVCRRT